ncbi:hypothetical protein LWI29_013276 [Acer saccharum]|uniref:Uncharacterized protein n=1 Tax=Acer saccharum TaxID=4024 RepID=A0AA39T1X6_ACESA|nr:hypothetical protein LWI29_013276 [Acer saccharum]
MSAKLRVLEHGLLLATYTQESLPALHKIRKYLVEATEEASVAYNKAVTRLHEYQGVDPRFDKIARQYHDIVKKLENMQWTIHQVEMDLIKARKISVTTSPAFHTVEFDRLPVVFFFSPSQVDCMDQVQFVVLYDGRWTDSGGKFRYESGKSRGVILPRETSYRVLLETVCGIVEEDPSEVIIQMKFNYVAPEAIPPIEVVNDDDVKFFLAENADVTTRSPLLSHYQSFIINKMIRIVDVGARRSDLLCWAIRTDTEDRAPSLDRVEELCCGPEISRELHLTGDGGLSSMDLDLEI